MVSEGIHTQYPPTPRFRDTKTDRGGHFRPSFAGGQHRGYHTRVFCTCTDYTYRRRGVPIPPTILSQQQARHPGGGDMPVQADWRPPSPPSPAHACAPRRTGAETPQQGAGPQIGDTAGRQRGLHAESRHPGKPFHLARPRLVWVPRPSETEGGRQRSIPTLWR